MLCKTLSQMLPHPPAKKFQQFQTTESHQVNPAWGTQPSQMLSTGEKNKPPLILEVKASCLRSQRLPVIQSPE